LRAAAIGWRLSQTLWVGGLWLLYFLVMPALEHYGLAPLLLQEIGSLLMRALLGVSAACVLVQLMLLAATPAVHLRRDPRAGLLLAALLLVASHFLLPLLGLESRAWQLFSYLATAACGLSLLLLPVPGER
jgi:uncharacterized membrane protein YGL010W